MNSNFYRCWYKKPERYTQNNIIERQIRSFLDIEKITHSKNKTSHRHWTIELSIAKSKFIWYVKDTQILYIILGFLLLYIHVIWMVKILLSNTICCKLVTCNMLCLVWLWKKMEKSFRLRSSSAFLSNLCEILTDVARWRL